MVIARASDDQTLADEVRDACTEVALRQGSAVGMTVRRSKPGA